MVFEHFCNLLACRLLPAFEFALTPSFLALLPNGRRDSNEEKPDKCYGEDTNDALHDLELQILHPLRMIYNPIPCLVKLLDGVVAPFDINDDSRVTFPLLPAYR
jgi:hypothetical protein